MVEHKPCISKVLSSITAPRNKKVKQQKQNNLGAGEMAQQLKALAALAEDWGLVPDPRGGSQPETHVVQTFTLAPTNTHTISKYMREQ